MQSTTMNSVFLECYLAHNLGDDLFLETLLRRYPDVHFTCVVDGSYDWLLERYHNISLVRPPRKKSALGGGRPRSRRQHPPDHRRQGRKVIPEPATRPRPSGPTKHGNGQAVFTVFDFIYE